MIETTERFLRDIADRVGLTAVDEVRLFPPMRQSGVETGVAVVAAIPLPPEGQHVHQGHGQGQGRSCVPLSVITTGIQLSLDHTHMTLGKYGSAKALLRNGP